MSKGVRFLLGMGYGVLGWCFFTCNGDCLYDASLLDSVGEIFFGECLGFGHYRKHDRFI